MQDDCSRLAPFDSLRSLMAGRETHFLSRSERITLRPSTTTCYFRITTREPTERMSDNSWASVGETSIVALGVAAGTVSGALAMTSVGVVAGVAVGLVALLRRTIVWSAVGVVCFCSTTH